MDVDDVVITVGLIIACEPRRTWSEPPSSVVVLSSSPSPRYILRHSKMDPPKVDVDIEAQTQARAQIKDIPETPKIATNEDPTPAPNTANPQFPTNADPQPHAMGLNEIPNWNTPAPKTAYNSEVQRGISTFPFHNL